MALQAPQLNAKPFSPDIITIFIVLIFFRIRNQAFMTEDICFLTTVWVRGDAKLLNIVPRKESIVKNPLRYHWENALFGKIPDPFLLRISAISASWKC